MECDNCGYESESDGDDFILVDRFEGAWFVCVDCVSQVKKDRGINGTL